MHFFTELGSMGCRSPMWIVRQATVGERRAYMPYVSGTIGMVAGEAGRAQNNRASSVMLQCGERGTIGWSMAAGLSPLSPIGERNHGRIQRNAGSRSPRNEAAAGNLTKRAEKIAR